MLNEIAAVFRIQYLYACGGMTVICSLIFVATSLATTGPATNRINAIIWSRNYWRRESGRLKELPWYRDYRYQSAALLAVAFMIVAAWW